MKTDARPPVTQLVGEFAASVSYSKLSPDVIEMARFCLLDWLGNAIAGARQPVAKHLFALADDYKSKREASILCSGKTATPAFAAMVNGTLAHAIDFDDVHLASGIHASAPIFAAVLAVAEAEELPIEKITEAFVAGHEVMARLGVVIGNEMFERNSHPTGTLGYFGATVATAKLLSLDAKGITNALGIAGGQAGSLTQVRGTMSKPFFAGHAAHGGVISSSIAAKGFKSAQDIFEGPQGLLATFGAKESGYEYMVADLGRRWEFLNNAFKAYAACAMNHAMIDGLLEIREAGVNPDEIQEIRAHIMPFATQYLNRPVLETGLAGKFSAQYCAAVALLDGEVQEKQFTDLRAKESRVLKLMDRVTLVPSEQYNMEGAKVEVTLANGRKETREISAVSGSPNKPFSWITLSNKFHSLTEQSICHDERKSLLDSFSRWPDTDVLKIVQGLRY